MASKRPKQPISEREAHENLLSWLRWSHEQEYPGEEMPDDEVLLARFKTAAPPPETATQQLLFEFRSHLMTPHRRGPASFYSVAKKLDVSTQRVYQWKEGQTVMPDNVASQICQVIYPRSERKTENKRWLCLLAAERADKAHDVHSAQLWRSLATKLAAVLFPLLLWLPTDVEALAAHAERPAEVRDQYILCQIRLGRWLGRIRRGLGARVRRLFVRAPGPGTAAALA